MSWDTKYRPLVYDDVLGQEGLTTLCRSYVSDGTGFQHSYLFPGPHGSGKTTMGRILARALLCEEPHEGNPCDACRSCKAILNGNSDAFVEIDAATNSGKDEIKKILDNLQYEAFSGSRRIYLFDECHRLSKQAMDALLKPLEDTLPGSEDRVLVCILCTTDPDAVRDTIASRTVSLQVRKCAPDQIAARLAYIAEQEGVEYDLAALKLIAEVRECHLRDSIKAAESAAKLGPLNDETVRSFLLLDTNRLYLSILANLGQDLGAVLQACQELHEVVSPATVYEALARMSMTLYTATTHKVGVIPSYWQGDSLTALQSRVGSLPDVSAWLATRPKRSTHATLTCDLTAIHGNDPPGPFLPLCCRQPDPPQKDGRIGQAAGGPDYSLHDRGDDDADNHWGKEGDHRAGGGLQRLLRRPGQRTPGGDYQQNRAGTRLRGKQEG